MLIVLLVIQVNVSILGWILPSAPATPASDCRAT
jgi:hypothetical protein